MCYTERVRIRAVAGLILDPKAVCRVGDQIRTIVFSLVPSASSLLQASKITMQRILCLSTFYLRLGFCFPEIENIFTWYTLAPLGPYSVFRRSEGVVQDVGPRAPIATLIKF